MKPEYIIPLVIVWVVFGSIIYGITFDAIRRLPQRIFAGVVAGPLIWFGWIVVWFCRWLFAK